MGKALCPACLCKQGDPHFYNCSYSGTFSPWEDARELAHRIRENFMPGNDPVYAESEAKWGEWIERYVAHQVQAEKSPWLERVCTLEEALEKAEAELTTERERADEMKKHIDEHYTGAATAYIKELEGKLGQAEAERDAARETLASWIVGFEVRISDITKGYAQNLVELAARDAKTEGEAKALRESLVEMTAYAESAIVHDPELQAGIMRARAALDEEKL